jgi:hypothetical protein
MAFLGFPVRKTDIKGGLSWIHFIMKKLMKNGNRCAIFVPLVK